MPSKVIHSDPTSVKVNGIELVYDTFGDPDAAPIVLVHGLGAQMVSWDRDFCEALASLGYWIIRFDNRDIGKSSWLDDFGAPNIMEMIRAASLSQSIEAPYTLWDMANDTIGLMDVLKIESAHLIGVSMGGMIVQSMAINHPDRLRTMTSIMSTTGNPDLPMPKAEAIEVLFRPVPTSLEEYIEANLATDDVLRGPRYPCDEERLRARSELEYDRGLHPQGFGRQLAAILASESRKELLMSITVPTLIIHGDADPLVPLEAGVDTAEAIPGAKLLILEGVGHSLPVPVWPEVFNAIVEHTKTLAHDEK
ncbi:MAG: alpha/beta fold hydrolase [Anaerolineales bacterium]|nr:alpha/beta fold hydrolase [Anaerolineales bacterium]